MPSQPTCRRAELEARVAPLEAALWQGGLNEALLPEYQATFRELETCIAEAGDNRHHFAIVIPVADSPLHLRDCLQSLVDLCEAYGYGGKQDGRWAKVEVLLADDSGDAAAIDQHRAIAAGFDRLGLTVHYFGLAEQIELIGRIERRMPARPPALQGERSAGGLAGCIGSHARTAFHHKGQGMMRNVAYLKLAQLYGHRPEPWIFYSIDADQEFRVKVATPEGGREVSAVNFLYRLDEIFRTTDVEIVTGKVVGDPPVSPAVMAGNFLADVLGFVGEMAAAARAEPYAQPAVQGGGDAAYHDMADLFGFKNSSTYRYRCPLPGVPSNAACFAEFGRHLASFFHGEHPTRITWFEYQAALASVQPARTIYTGNYAFRPAALRWFIPYAPLRLRMSGPTMGRLLKAEMGARFASANLPMLHKRTLETTGAAEFRPGVVAEAEVIDLSDEFERQFHGDVMLFTLPRLTALGYPAQPLAEGEVRAALEATRSEMREKYGIKQAALLAGLEALRSRLDTPAAWWRDLPALADFRAFAANLERNFGPASPAYARIDDPAVWAAWRERQVAAIQGLTADRTAWGAALDWLARGQSHRTIALTSAGC